MKQIILFGAPFYFALILLRLALGWFGVYENQLIEPKLLLISFLAGEALLFLWAYYVEREKLTRGSYDNHFFTSVFVWFIVVVSAVVLFSHDLAIVLNAYFNNEASFGVTGFIVALILTAVVIAVGQVTGENYHLEKLKRNGIN